MEDSGIFDIVIIGGGPAGMTAALYALRANKSVCVIEKSSFGGQITHSPRVENYPGTMVMSGNDFANSLSEQILALGAEVELETVTGIENGPMYKEVSTEEGNTYQAKSVIIAVGAKHRPLGLPDESQWVGNGEFFCAVCDGALFSGKKVAVIGGGNSALQEVILLAETSSEVVVVQNLPDYTGEMKLRETVQAKSNVHAVFGTVVKDYIVEDGEMKGLKLLESATGVESELRCDGVFVAIGLVPENEAFAGVAALNQYGYLDSGEDCTTRTPGVFVAGDCRSKAIRQLTTAAGDGAVAALSACCYIDTM